MLAGAEFYVFKKTNEIYALARCPLNTLGKSQEGSLHIGRGQPTPKGLLSFVPQPIKNKGKT
jgi:hypothetical protein